MTPPTDEISQPDPLLTTKFYIPRPRARLVTRPRIATRLNQSLSHKLTLISAPAGFGKTTLLSSWIDDLNSNDEKASPTANRKTKIQHPVAWLSLDPDDNDPARLLSYVVAALQSIQPDVGQATLQNAELEKLHDPTLYSTGQRLLTSLINEIATIPDDFVLILDDYHFIEHQALHEAVTFLLEHSPPPMHLIIASRHDPPLPLARLRAQGQLLELDATDLRFTAEEAATFLNQLMGLELSSADITALEARTEGWIAGLQMAALSMQDQPDAAGFIKTFTGSHRYIIDYLAEEVLNHQPEPIRQFLLKTSILDRLCGPLSDAVLSSGAVDQDGEGDRSFTSALLPSGTAAGSQAILEYLERINLFLIPLDDERRWYRYHHLFAEFLRGHLQRRVGPQAVAELHRRAAAWCEQNSLSAQAMSHALAVADVERAVRLVEQSGRSLLRRSELATLLSWLEELPQEIVRARPRLSLFQAWALVLTGQLDAAESWLADFGYRLSDSGLEDVQAVGSDHQRELFGEVTAIAATVAYLRRDLPWAIKLYRRAFERLPEDNLFLRGAVAMSLATACTQTGDVAGAKWAFAQGKTINQAEGNLKVALIASWNLAQLHVGQGQLRRAAELYRQATQLAARQTEQGATPPTAGRVYVGLAEIFYQWNDLDEAARHLLKALELGRQGGDATTVMSGYLTLAQVKQARRDPEGAHQAIDLANKYKKDHGLFSWDIRLAAYQLRRSLAQNDLEAASRWAQKCHLSLKSLNREDSAGYAADLHYIEQISQVRLCLAREQPDRALALLIPLLEPAEAADQTGRVIEILTQQALAYQAQTEDTAALAALEKALTLAEPEGYIRLFIDEGVPMAELLWQTTSRKHTPTYISDLLAAFSAETQKDQSFKPPDSSLIEPLSERELEILDLIASGMSNRQIAEVLFLTVGTVKWHINNLYGKLGVRRRTQAVARARELKLL